MTTYQWLTVGLGALGFLITWTGLWFGAGRFLEQVRAEFKKHVGDERDKIIEKIDALKAEFEDDQRIQEDRFAEVSAAMREKVAQVEQHFRQHELYSERTYAQKGELEKATDRIEAAIRSIAADLKDDFRDRIDDLRKSFEPKH